MPLNNDRVTHNAVPLTFALIALPCAIAVWFNAVSGSVREPYLDEVFHVGQAQAYCDGKFNQWDPKITTPAGLYLVSYLFYLITGRCDLDYLRALNALFLFAIFFLLLHTAPPVSPRTTAQLPSQKPTLFFSLSNICPQQIHSALNICLFPPLFFFSALYYTDVGSTLCVLLFVRHCVEIHSRGPPRWHQALASILIGLFALSFRQTNIFWVAVFPIALILTNTLHEKTEAVKHTDLRSVMVKSWKEATLYDPQMRDATIEDFFFCTLSLATIALRRLTIPTKIPNIIRLLMPYILLLAGFGGFVLWNGGVVLGDKSNHVATLHLPQMLYLWAYTTFFSFGLTYPYVAQALLAIVAGVPIVAILEPLLIFSRHKVLPRPLVLAAFVMGAMMIVRFNTIVHPFTLADNRHFTFYVFRILLSHPAIKYVAVPVYMACAWSVCQALGAPAKLFEVKEDEKADRSASENTEKGETQATEEQSKKLEKKDNRKKDDMKNEKNGELQLLRLNDAPFGEGSTVSFVVVWIAVSALQLITAPLVEPRYFILPWIMWRLRVPQAHPGASLMSRPTHKNWEKWWKKEQEKGNVERWRKLRWIWSVMWTEHDHRLWIETLWFAAINIVVGWIFLNWGFEWKQEPGKVQRFMW